MTGTEEPNPLTFPREQTQTSLVSAACRIRLRLLAGELAGELQGDGAAEPDMSGRGVLGFRGAGGGPEPVTVLGSAQVRAALEGLHHGRVRFGRDRAARTARRLLRRTRDRTLTPDAETFVVKLWYTLRR